jgi:CobQ-like glutamine amidotransferase family enzyme
MPFGDSTERSVRQTYSDGPILSDSLEVQRWMLRIGLEKLEVFPRELLKFW